MDASNRKESRISFSVPVRVSGRLASGTSWEEMSTSVDASRSGLSFVLQHPVEKGEVLFLNLPLPKSYRTFDLNEQSYRVWALVRNVTPGSEGSQVGVFFLGRNPPHGYDARPGMRYLLPSDPPPKKTDRRREERRTVFVTLRLTRLAGEPREELTVAEDISRGGARVPTQLPVKIGEIVIVQEVGGDFECRAEVRNLFVGKDHVVRLNLKFLDGRVPERLLG